MNPLKTSTKITFKDLMMENDFTADGNGFGNADGFTHLTSEQGEYYQHGIGDDSSDEEGEGLKAH
jgi:hypothetical protein